MFNVVLKAMFGVNYLVGTFQDLGDALHMMNYVVSTNEPEYFDGLFVNKVAVEHRNGFEVSSTRV